MRFVNHAKSFLRQLWKMVKHTLGYRIAVKIPVLQSELLVGRIALVTGGTSGIGYAIARSFLQSGAKVIITSREEIRLNGAISKLRGEVSNAVIAGIVLDLLDINSFFKKTEEANGIFGPVDILVNNAGIVSGQGNTFDNIMNTNLRGPCVLGELITSEWIEKGIKGNLLNICSTSSFRPGIEPYVFAKWGLRSLTLGFAKKLIPYGIVVNGLAPGPTATAHFIAHSDGDITWEKNPSRRLAMPEEIGNLATILVSDLGRLIVGDVVVAGGGAGVITFDDV